MESDAAGWIMNNGVAAVTRMRQSADQTCGRLPGPHATAASGVSATHQGYGSEARDTGGDLSRAQEEGQQQKQALQRVRMQLGSRDHGQHSQRLRKHRTTGDQSLMTGTGRQAGMERAHDWMPHAYSSAAQHQAPVKGCSRCEDGSMAPHGDVLPQLAYRTTKTDLFCKNEPCRWCFHAFLSWGLCVDTKHCSSLLCLQAESAYRQASAKDDPAPPLRPINVGQVLRSFSTCLLNICIRWLRGTAGVSRPVRSSCQYGRVRHLGLPTSNHSER